MDDIRAPIKWGQKVEEVETKYNKKTLFVFCF